MRELWVVQPYVPKYRVPFFEALRRSLSVEGVQLNVAAGSPQGEQALRGDSTRPDWLYSARDRVVRVAGRSVTLTRTAHLWRRADAVIVPHMGSSLDSLLAVAGRRVRVGVWGHIAPYTSEGNPIDLAIERWQLRRADHVFAYTPGGTAYARAAGVEATKVTTVMNTVDTTALTLYLSKCTTAEISAFRVAHGIPEGPVLSWMGGLDATKRVQLLVDALEVLDARGSDVHIVVAGAGSESGKLGSARDRGQVTLVGYVDGAMKATVLKMSQGVVNPGRIGLLAVDALVAQRPVLTTEWPYHAPEAEYLTEGRSRLTSADDPVAFADLLQRAVDSFRTPAKGFLWSAPSLEDMVSNYKAGVMRMLGTDV